mgnify:CR=1 FL=1
MNNNSGYQGYVHNQKETQLAFRTGPIKTELRKILKLIEKSRAKLEIIEEIIQTKRMIKIRCRL